ncbi:PaaI family thioesterase [Quisquiliibacterium transsilvanicum]
MSHAFPASSFTIVEAGSKRATIRRPVTQDDLRPGDTVSGPTLMALADTALYVAIHATLGITPHAVTSNMNINFLRRPPADRALVAECRLLRVGRTLAVGEVSLFSEGMDEPVAHVVGSYVIPRERPSSGAIRTTDPE